MRRKVIAGNWKMNMLPADTINFIEGLAPLVKDSEMKLYYVYHIQIYFMHGIQQKALIFILVQKICTGKKRVHIQEKFLDKC